MLHFRVDRSTVGRRGPGNFGRGFLGTGFHDGLLRTDFIALTLMGGGWPEA